MIYDRAKVLERTQITASDEKWFIGDFCLVTVPNLILHTGSQVNAGSKLLGRETIEIGEYATVGYDCLLMTSTDRPAKTLANDFIDERNRLIDSRPIKVGDNAFIGSKSTLMPGVVIPDGCVIQQGSVVDYEDLLEPWTVHFREGGKRRRAIHL